MGDNGIEIVALCSHVDLVKLPRLSPSELDMASILDRVIRLERQSGGVPDIQSKLSSLEG